jgi:hypothetical protein
MREWNAWHSANVGRKRKSIHKPTPTEIPGKKMQWDVSDVLTH